MTTVNDTAAMLALKKKIDNLSPPERLILASQLLQQGRLQLAEYIAEAVVDELKALRMFGMGRKDLK